MSEVTFEELGGRQRTLTLRGGGLPFQGAEWPSGQTVDTSWNPGSPVATQQVLGPTEPPSSWSGEWNTTRLISLPSLLTDSSGEQSITRADELSDVVDSFRLSGQLLRVTWVAGPNRRRVRYGRLVEFVPSFVRADDLTWRMKLDWIGRTPTAQGVALTDDHSALRAAALAANDAAARIAGEDRRGATERFAGGPIGLISSNPFVKNSASPFTLGQLEAFVDSPRVLVDSFARAARAIDARLTQLGNIALKVRDLPAAVLGQIADASIDAVATANQFVDALSRESPESMSTRVRVANLLDAASYYSSAQTGAELLAQEASRARLASLSRQSAVGRPGSDAGAMTGAGDLLAVIIPKSSDTMLDISRRYYDGDDLSYELSRANQLPGATITPPRAPLAIPSRAVLDRLRQSGA